MGDPGRVHGIRAGRHGQRPVLDFGDDLRDDCVAAVTLVSLDDVEVRVSDERVVTMDCERRISSGVVTGHWLVPSDRRTISRQVAWSVLRRLVNEMNSI